MVSSYASQPIAPCAKSAGRCTQAASESRAVVPGPPGLAPPKWKDWEFSPNVNPVNMSAPARFDAFEQQRLPPTRSQRHRYRRQQQWLARGTGYAMQNLGTKMDINFKELKQVIRDLTANFEQLKNIIVNTGDKLYVPGAAPLKHLDSPVIADCDEEDGFACDAIASDAMAIETANVPCVLPLSSPVHDMHCSDHHSVLTLKPVPAYDVELEVSMPTKQNEQCAAQRVVGNSATTRNCIMSEFIEMANFTKKRIPPLSNAMGHYNVDDCGYVCTVESYLQETLMYVKHRGFDFEDFTDEQVEAYTTRLMAKSDGTCTALLWSLWNDDSDTEDFDEHDPHGALSRYVG